MKRKYIFLIGFMFTFPYLALAQNAPITKIGSVLEASPGPETYTIPISVSNFSDIASITLSLTYDPSVATFNGSLSNPAFSGIQITNVTPGIVIIGWAYGDGSSTITLPDASILAELEFTYNSGSTYLQWDNTSNGGDLCEYTNGDGITLIDSPTSEFYIDGALTDHSAPITYAPVILNAPSGAVDLPVTVDNFTDIGAVALKFLYDPNAISFNSFTAGIGSGIWDVDTSPSPSSVGKNELTISWISNSPSEPASLSNGSSVVTLHFTYAPSGDFPQNHTELTWMTGTDDYCQYGDANDTPLPDVPKENFYIDGIVAGQVSPITSLPVISNATTSSLVTVPITVTGFNDIGAIALRFTYDVNVITYNSHTINSSLSGIPIVFNSNTPGIITISYYGPAITLNDLESIVDISFNYISGTTTLSWINNGSDCQYGDYASLPLWDRPFEEYYINGVVAGQVAPQIKADPTIAIEGAPISIPITVKDFNNISSFSLTLDYNPGVLTYVNATPNSSIINNFIDGTTSLGRILLEWSTANPLTLSDETILIYLNFNYNGGSTPLIWFDNGSSCEITAGITDDILYDQPTEDYYINGLVEGADFIWLGSTSPDWNTSSNWSDNIVPNIESVVSIPSSPEPDNWPTFTGDFTLGVEGNSINLDVSSEMTVTGDMTINPGNSFNNLGSGILKVGGDWLNSGVFVPGTGEVLFTNQTGGLIPDGYLPANEVQNYLQTADAVSMTPISGGISGPSGDNAHSDIPIGFTFLYAGTEFIQVRISTDGWVSLNLSGDDADAIQNSRLFFTSEPTTVLAPWWDNLEADGSSVISYLTSGAAPNRVFTVEWNNMLSYSTGSTTRINFQLKLYETTNEIEFCYGNVVAGTPNSSEGASIGIKGTTGGTDDFIEATTNSKNTAVTTLTSENNWPVVNYIFTPPPDKVTFYKMTLGENVLLEVETDVNIIGNTP